MRTTAIAMENTTVKNRLSKKAATPYLPSFIIAMLITREFLIIFVVLEHFAAGDFIAYNPQNPNTIQGIGTDE